MHTPGPWRVMESFDKRETFVVAGPDVQPFNGHLIASKTTCPDWDDNARLIAAAPVGYELALQVLDGNFDLATRLAREFMAIAKAEGK